MTPKQTAIFNVAGILATTVGTCIVMAVLVQVFSVVELAIGAGVLMIAWLVKMLYDIELDRATRLQELDKTN